MAQSEDRPFLGRCPDNPKTWDLANLLLGLAEKGIAPVFFLFLERTRCASFPKRKIAHKFLGAEQSLKL